MTPRNYIQLAGPAVTLLGVGLSIYGTYYATTWVQLMDIGDFLVAGFQAVALTLVGRRLRAFDVVVAVSKHQAEDRRRTILGISFIFVGFVLLGVGALFWGADMIWGIFAASAPNPAP